MEATNVSKLIGGFYNAHPFPGYNLNDYHQASDLYYDANMYGRLLADQLPENITIIDFGCGTGRHSCLLALKNRKVIGIDISDESLKIANQLKEKLGIKNVSFMKQDIFNLDLDLKADIIMSIGVLHHTYNIEKAFEQIIKHLKPNGYVILGLYNTYGRFLTYALRLANKLTFYNIEKLDFYINNIARSKFEKDMWRYDLYRCPHELTITIDGVLRLFRRHKIKYLNAFPNKIALDQDVFPRECEKILSQTRKGKLWEHLYIQAKWVFSEYYAGGLFMMIGRKED